MLHKRDTGFIWTEPVQIIQKIDFSWRRQLINKMLKIGNRSVDPWVWFYCYNHLFCRKSTDSQTHAEHIIYMLIYDHYLAFWKYKNKYDPSNEKKIHILDFTVFLSFWFLPNGPLKQYFKIFFPLYFRNTYTVSEFLTRTDGIQISLTLCRAWSGSTLFVPKLSPLASENLNQYINLTAFDLVSTVCRCLCPIKGRYVCLV